MSDRFVVKVRVKPRSSRDGILGVEHGRVVVRTTSPPADGRANKDVAQQLARAFGVPRGRISLKAGGKSRLKTFVVEDPVTIPDWATDPDFS
jgi:uncharacterized protein (TIGR00251 family)